MRFPFTQDALPVAENAYASVADALPSGKVCRIRVNHGKGPGRPTSDTDSDDCSSVDRDKAQENIYSRVNRRPTPHKKRNKSRHADGVVCVPPLPPYTDDRQVLVQEDHLERCELMNRLLLVWVYDTFGVMKINIPCV